MDSTTQIEIIKHLSIPVVAGLVGWSTNWVAIQLTFYPIEFIGFLKPFLGWQGIIPSKAKKMAKIGVEQTLSKLGSLSEVFVLMDPEIITSQILRIIKPQLNAMTDDVISKDHLVLWQRLPKGIKNQIYQRIHNEFPKIITNLVKDVGGQIEDLVLLNDMVIEQLVKEKHLLNKIFLECGEAEFKFIIISGLYFGALFGACQMVIWYYHPVWWVLPLFGLLVGLVTNWIALNIIFRPLHPIKIGSKEFQGLFLKRQDEVAKVYSRIVTHELITIRHIVHAMLTGPRSAKTHALIRKYVKPIVDESLGMAKTAIMDVVGEKMFSDIKDNVGQKALFVSEIPFNDPLFNQDRAQVVEELMQERMKALKTEEFVELLRPCFQEDEWKLILLGAILGLGAGLAQLFLIFGGL